MLQKYLTENRQFYILYVMHIHNSFFFFFLKNTLVIWIKENRYFNTSSILHTHTHTVHFLMNILVNFYNDYNAPLNVYLIFHNQYNMLNSAFLWYIFLIYKGIIIYLYLKRFIHA